MYLMNRDGFTLLAMGYTGEKAMRFKLAYIKQFNEMDKILEGKLVEKALTYISSRCVYYV